MGTFCRQHFIAVRIVSNYCLNIASETFTVVAFRRHDVEEWSYLSRNSKMTTSKDLPLPGIPRGNNEFGILTPVAIYSKYASVKLIKWPCTIWYKKINLCYISEKQRFNRTINDVSIPSYLYIHAHPTCAWTTSERLDVRFRNAHTAIHEDADARFQSAS